MINCAREQMRYSEMTVRNRTAHHFISNKTGIVVLQYPPNGSLSQDLIVVFSVIKSDLKHPGKPLH